MKIVAKTDQGKVRKDNQDSFAAGELPGGVVWAVVCDGMGGAAGGSVASQTAVKMISEKIASGYQHGILLFMRCHARSRASTAWARR